MTAFSWYNEGNKKPSALLSTARGLRHSEVNTMSTDDRTTTPPRKQCRKCGEFKPATREYFRPKKANKDGLYSYCHVCNAADVKAWQQKNPDKVKGYKRAWLENNPTYLAEYYQANRTSYALKGKLHRKNNKAKYDQYWIEWKQRNPQKDKLNKAAAKLRRRARKAGVAHDFTAREWRDCLDYWHSKCAVCGRDLQGLMHKASADHWIPLSKHGGTTATNIIPLCHGIGGCNNSKKDSDPIEWLVDKFGQRKTNAIVNRILAYFTWVKERKGK